MLAELVPKGKENLFFSLFGIVNKGSAWVGPVIIGALTEKTDNIYTGWAVVLAFFVAGLAVLFFVDVKKAKIDIERYYLEIEQRELAALQLDPSTSDTHEKLELESSSVEKVLTPSEK